MSPEMEFTPSAQLSVGVELELQILNSRDFNLARDAIDLISLVDKTPHPGEVKPEITESMIELNSSVHLGFDTLRAELRQLRDQVTRAAAQLNVRIAGGGSHPFHKWNERRIYPSERFKHLLEVYGYLAKQFTVFGQHIHIGVPDGDSALYLAHALARYIPHFIALSASSPFQQGADTGFQSSRLNTVSAFPLSGVLPFVHTWRDFAAYFEKMRGFGIVDSMKDFYWDIRPKPEYGTVEIRVLDTPLTVERAAQLGAYAQTLAHYLLARRGAPSSDDIYFVYKYNRFQACRYGLAGTIIDTDGGGKLPLQRDVLATLEILQTHAAQLGNSEALSALQAEATSGHSDAEWLREIHRTLGSYHDVARRQSEEWAGKAGV
ncbi:MAG: YbdK family carboxylate-amine ligase [Burkholderiales bacterium]